MDVFVARQPVFDRSRAVYGYELLFRSGDARNLFDSAPHSNPTAQVVAGSLLSIGLDQMVGGRRAFVNFDRASLVNGLHLALPPESTVIEVLETVQPDEEVVEACRRLKRQGYRIALDDFVDGPTFTKLIALADVIKVDVLATTREEQLRLIRAYQPGGRAMLAEKVETTEEFEWARKAGYELFQGYFFARPDIVRGREIPAGKVACIQLLSEVQRPELDFERLEQLIRHDVSLSFRLFRYVNSARFRVREEIHSYAHALSVLGESGIRHWAVLAALPVLARDKPGELVRLSLARARFCELLSEAASFGKRSQAFLTGLFSLIDALIDLPLGEALARINIDPSVCSVLLGKAAETDPLGKMYRLAAAYEAGAWKDVSRLAETMHFDVARVCRAYAESLEWAEGALRAM